MFLSVSSKNVTSKHVSVLFLVCVVVLVSFTGKHSDVGVLTNTNCNQINY